MDYTTCYTYRVIFSRELSNTIWKLKRKIPNFDFFQLYFVITEKYNGDRYEELLLYKRLKPFQLFYEGQNKTRAMFH